MMHKKYNLLAPLYQMTNVWTSSWLYRYIVSAIIHPKNFIHCCKYPFQKVHNRWNGKFMGYYFTEINEYSLGHGWWTAFGQQLIDDIAHAFRESNLPKRKWEKNISWQDVKSKFGELRLYASAPEKVRYVLDKYEVLSIGYCEMCGKPSRYRTQGWISYLCESCFVNTNISYYKSRVDYEKYKLSCKLTKDDIPHCVRFTEDGQKEIDYKEEYGIDFEDLWGLK